MGWSGSRAYDSSGGTDVFGTCSQKVHVPAFELVPVMTYGECVDKSSSKHSVSQATLKSYIIWERGYRMRNPKCLLNNLS